MEKLEFKLPDALREQIDNWIYAETKGIVQSGPFKGMQLLREQAWVSGGLSPMLLGCHEQELHEVIEKEITRLALLPNPRVVNVGCAEGYYAVGLARRLPKATVWAIDTNDECLKLSRETAELNEVTLVIGDDLSNVFAAPDLIIMDCEGAEVNYLDHEKFPGLLGAHIIVEIHNMLNGPLADEIIFTRWKDRNHITAWLENGRNPNAFEILWSRSSFFRWMAVCENRPCMMVWFVMTPKEENKTKSREDWMWEKNTWLP